MRFLLYLQVAAVVARLHAAEAQRHAVGEAQSVNRRRNLFAERNQAGLPAQLHAGLRQLLGERHAVGVPGDEDVQVLLLQLAGDPHGVLDRRGSADDGGKAGGRAIDELDAALADDHVAGRAQPDAIHRSWADQVLAGFDDLEGEQRRHAGIQRVAQIRQPDIVVREPAAAACGTRRAPVSCPPGGRPAGPAASR